MYAIASYLDPDYRAPNFCSYHYNECIKLHPAMASSRNMMAIRSSNMRFPYRSALRPIDASVSSNISRCQRQPSKRFSSSPRAYRPQSDGQESFGKRLRRALNNTKIKWYPIPVGVGIGFLGLAQAYRVNEREKARRQKEENESSYPRSVGSSNNGEENDSQGQPKKRPKIRPTGPWYVRSENGLDLSN
jgi:hypothetical protein